MPRQSKEDRAVSAKPSKDGLNPGVEPPGGGKAIPVNEQMRQLELCFEPAEDPVHCGTGADGEMATPLRQATPCAAPLSEHKDEKIASAVREVFDFTPNGIIDSLRLRDPIFKATAAYGHFGRTPRTDRTSTGRQVRLFPWEETDRVEELRTAAGV